MSSLGAEGDSEVAKAIRPKEKPLPHLTPPPGGVSDLVQTHGLRGPTSSGGSKTQWALPVPALLSLIQTFK